MLSSSEMSINCYYHMVQFFFLLCSLFGFCLSQLFITVITQMRELKQDRFIMGHSFRGLNPVLDYLLWAWGEMEY
jgi:hypothetical protein